jgi:hypothetical protein
MVRHAVGCVILLAAGATAAPVPREAQRPPIPLAGTVWDGDGVCGPTVYEFHPDGMMSITHGNHRYENTGTWRQNGRDIYWETCGQYCEFLGTQTGSSITGRSWNKPGGEWTLKVQRKSSPAGR